MQLNLQEELVQLNRLTEEMLYLLIAIVGNVLLSTLCETSYSRC